jgi:hypothetical protein
VLLSRTRAVRRRHVEAIADARGVRHHVAVGEADDLVDVVRGLEPAAEDDLHDTVGVLGLPDAPWRQPFEAHVRREQRA